MITYLIFEELNDFPFSLKVIYDLNCVFETFRLSLLFALKLDHLDTNLGEFTSRRLESPMLMVFVPRQLAFEIKVFCYGWI